MLKCSGVIIKKFNGINMDKIVCFGKNYQDHMLELGDKPVSKPVIFLKPPSVLKQCANWGGTVNATLTDSETHYECELVIKLSSGGYKMTTSEAKSSICAYTIGLDMTLRVEQAKLKAAGHPWTTGKVFPDAAIIGPWIETSSLDFLDLDFTFTLDNELKQKSSGHKMIFNPIDLIVYASNYFPLCEGDILFTGTPSGVGMVNNKSQGVLSISNHKYNVEWNTK